VALEFAFGSIDWNTVDSLGGTKVVSGLAFQPKAIMFVINGQQGALDTTSEIISGRVGIGFATSPSDRRCVGMIDTDAAATMDCGTAHHNAAVCVTVSAAGVIDGLMDLTAIASDGFTLTIDDVTPVNLTIFWYAWGGADITNFESLDITEPGATGNVDYGTFAPDVVFFAGVQGTTANSGAVTDAGIMFGAATGLPANFHQFVLAINQDDASMTADTDRYGTNVEALAMMTTAGGNPSARASYQGTVVANTFRLNWAARAGTRKFIALAIKGGQWRAGSFLVDASPETLSGLPFQPKGAITATHGTVVQGTGVSTTEAVLSIGCFSSPTSERAMAYRSENATASSAAEVNLALEFDACAILPSAAGGLDTVLQCSAVNSDGFAVSRATGTTNMELFYVAFADAPLAGYMDQQRQKFRGVFSRVFGRVN
jgi:hypothetical protein